MTDLARMTWDQLRALTDLAEDTGALTTAYGTRTIRASKPWPAPQAAGRAHPPQPAAGTATDTRTAAPA